MTWLTRVHRSVRTSLRSSVRPHTAAARLAVTLVAMGVCHLAAAPAPADILRGADAVLDYVQGADAGALNDPAVAVGLPSTAHTIGSPDNSSVVSLGQRGSITLGFNDPVMNQPPTAANPRGYDMIITGNTLAFGVDMIRFIEPGFVEVAVDSDADGSAAGETWHLILPRRFDTGSAVDFPPSMLATLPGAAFTSSTLLFDGYADTVPFNGPALAAALASMNVADVVLDDPATALVEGLGGAGVDISRAVLQGPPGEPTLDAGGDFQFVTLDHVDFMRITDAIIDDVHDPSVLGGITTELDGVIALPNFNNVPEPATGAVMLAFMMMHIARSGRRRRQ